MAYFAMAADMIIINIVAVFAYWFYLDEYLLPHEMPPIYGVLVAAPVLLLAFQFDRLYRSWRLNKILTLLGTFSKVWMAVLLVEIVLLFLSKSSTQVSRGWFLLFGVGAFVALSILRLLAYYFLHSLRKRGYNYRTLMIVGRSATSDEVIRVIAASPFSGLRLVGQVQPEEVA
jgi:putative colanic acid biosynthesis UDP-glucose lipid carrier transferase